ncbi:MAG TPA: hypothetical protein VG962_12080 [Steroidobacteraceae bacterium]|nr:hypothetical protein [Steroidobacteraceae bacterium]
MNKLNAAERAQNRAQAIADSNKLIADMQLQCDPTDAELIGIGKVSVDGTLTRVKAYEVACSNHIGYILESQGTQKPLAMSCFAAAATRSADMAKGVKSNFYCEFETNKDITANAAAVLAATGTDCDVSKAQWFGITSSTQTEYTEVACKAGDGYLLKIPRTGAAPITALSCQDAAKQGLKCNLTDAGPVEKPVTKQILLDALKSYDVKCTPAQFRLIGRESVDKRYVVELQCPEHPKGLVAFIPLEGNSSSFEAIDCDAAAEQQIQCKFAAPK